MVKVSVRTCLSNVFTLKRLDTKLLRYVFSHWKLFGTEGVLRFLCNINSTPPPPPCLINFKAEKKQELICFADVPQHVTKQIKSINVSPFNKEWRKGTKHFSARCYRSTISFRVVTASHWSVLSLTRVMHCSYERGHCETLALIFCWMCRRASAVPISTSSWIHTTSSFIFTSSFTRCSALRAFCTSFVVITMTSEAGTTLRIKHLKHNHKAFSKCTDRDSPLKSIYNQRSE